MGGGKCKQVNKENTTAEKKNGVFEWGERCAENRGKRQEGKETRGEGKRRLSAG